MHWLGNIVWLVFGGLMMGLGYMVAGLGVCLTIVGLPFGIRGIKFGIEVLLPFGKELEELPNANSSLRVVFNVIWLVFFGWEIAIGHVVLALLLGLTIIGIPFAWQHLKLVPLALLPFGRELVAR